MDAPEVEIAETADYPTLGALRWRWVVEGSGGRPLVGREEFISAFAAWASANTDTHTCAVVRRSAEVIVGMCWIAQAPRVPSPRAIHRRNAELQSVYVVPEERGAGIGLALVRFAIDEARRLGAERVVVHSSEQALPLYTRAGFASSADLMHIVLTDG